MVDLSEDSQKEEVMVRSNSIRRVQEEEEIIDIKLAAVVDVKPVVKLPSVVFDGFDKSEVAVL